MDQAPALSPRGGSGGRQRRRCPLLLPPLPLLAYAAEQSSLVAGGGGNSSRQTLLDVVTLAFTDLALGVSLPAADRRIRPESGPGASP